MRASAVRRLSLAASGIVALMMVGSAVAWACSAQAKIDPCRDRVQSGVAGGSILVCGSDFIDESGTPVPVAIRWESPDGQVLRTTQGPAFRVPVTIPATAAVGNHQFVLVFTGDGVERTLQQGFRVTATAEESTPGRESNTANTSSGADADAVATTPGAVTPGVATSDATPSAAASSATPSPSAGTNEVPSVLRSLPASANPGAVRAPSGRVVFGGSVAPAAVARTAPSAQAAQAVADDEASPAVGPGALNGDLWSDYGSGTLSQVTGLNAPASGSAGSGSTSAALAMFGAGLVALLGGFGLAELRRKRVPVGAGS